MGKQAFVKSAIVNLVYVADSFKMKNFATDTGFISQNVYLFCASKNLSTKIKK